MQIKNRLENYKDIFFKYLQRMNDIRFAAQVGFVVIVLLVSWSGVRSIQTNYKLQEQIAALKQQDAVQKLQNDNLALQNQYLNSNQYLELSARENLGLASPGEKEVIVPARVAKTYEVPVPSVATVSDSQSNQPAYQHNVQSWVDFFLHRKSN